MSLPDGQADRLARARKRHRRVRRNRVAAVGSLILFAAVVVAVVLGSTSGSRSSRQNPEASARHGAGGTSTASATGTAATAAVPILMYHVINVPPPGAASPSLYVPADEFSAQMDALKAAGWRAVTLDQLEASWTHGVSLGTGKPIVITFDVGYASQFTNAAPILKRLGWAGVENLQLSGLPPSDGGLTDAQVRGLIGAGWELDTQGTSGTDLTTVDPTSLQDEVATSRQTLRSRYGVPVNWFSYPLGHYNPTVVAAVRAAGYVGATTVIPGWATPQQDRFRLPRLGVTSGTSSSQLLAQIAAAKASASIPDAYSGP